MKGTINKALTIGLMFVLHSSISFAGENVPFFYNVLPVEANNSIIDTSVQQTIKFELYENENEIYYNDSKLEIVNDSFEVNIAGLAGKTTFTFYNDKNEQVTFTYFLSDEKDFVNGYDFSGMKNIKTFVKTIENIKVIYTNKDAKVMSLVEKYLKSIPSNVRSNVEEIVLVPYKNTGKVAGVTKCNKVTLYNLSKYSAKTIQNIVIHEVAHTWADSLMQQKKIDFQYTEYAKAVKADKKFVSNYTKKYIIQKEDYSEDFADAIAFYLMNTKNFSKKYANRTAYIEEIIK